MITKLDRLVEEVGALQSKLILIVGAPRTGKTALLQALAKKSVVSVLSVGSELSKRLSVFPKKTTPPEHCIRLCKRLYFFSCLSAEKDIGWSKARNFSSWT
jgi:chloramphenicol 3-O-phosphotransferase